jgi:glycosyltransferase involved in cell wall biosynthesis
MSMKELVSIIIPAYNAEKWICECIESALSQTWRWKEIIVIDDGSKDNTLERAKSLSSEIVVVRSQENCGASAARNHGLSIAQGSYIQYLDADDLLSPEKIEWQLRNSQPGAESKTLLSGAWGTFLNSSKIVNYSQGPLWESLLPVEWMYRKLEHGTWMAIESWLVSRKLTESAGLWNETLLRANDGEYFNRVLACCDLVRFVPESRSLVRRLNFGISSNLTLSEKKLESLAFTTVSSIRTLLSMEDSERTREVCRQHLDRWALYFFPEKPEIYAQMKTMAKELGGELREPRLRKKYRMLKWIVGFRIAKKIQLMLPSILNYLKSSLLPTDKE